ncbi:MAG: GGDEF domain-containing protein [Lachnospiraceae bacterium]
MDKYSIKNLTAEEKEAFYQSKYDYYRVFNTGLIIVSVLAYFSFFFTDCGIFGRFAKETVIPRFIIVIPFIIYLILEKRVRNYKFMVLASYVMIHLIIICTDWSTFLLPDRQHAISGMIIMNLIFVCAGFCAPFSYSFVAHMLMLVDIAIANVFIHYDNLQMMYMFNIPCIVAICVMHYIMQNVYLEQYITKGKLQSMAVLDQLTQVYNRNILKEISDPATFELRFSEKYDTSILLIDIDFFKKVNDMYGHEAGDKVLIALAGELKSLVRATDYVIRWGGEEFLIFMPGCPIENAMDSAERIRKNVEIMDNGVCCVTISIGVAPYEGGDYHATIKRADDALYQAKNNGRNCIVQYQENDNGS